MAGMPASEQVTAVPEPAPACPHPVPLSLSFPCMNARRAASHLDVRELAQVSVHSQQRLVHQLLVVIHPEQVIVLKEAAAGECISGRQPPQPTALASQDLGAQLLPHHFKIWWLLKTSVSSSVKWASSLGQQDPMGGPSHLPLLTSAILFASSLPGQSGSYTSCRHSFSFLEASCMAGGAEGPCCSQGHGDLGWRVPRGPGGMWASPIVLALSPQALTPSQLHMGRPGPASVKSGPPRPRLPITFDRGQVRPEILLKPGALILQRKR